MGSGRRQESRKQLLVVMGLLSPCERLFSEFSGFLLTFLRFSGLLQKALLFQKKATFNNQDIMQEVNFRGFYFPALALVHIMNLSDGG